ncbi:antibiotic biosynthesis monooxygenase family protein [Nonomuraea guangzhouensis]|uniref:Antibiotic biosynthesis monooxygenase family protein n=1 Tax=Nonomuraea guangzhouensis TaxID=1291555 RepID=A0ABW4G900_9ACTN|nr:antibiotic biosynthesis monooxygenase family protein [Nonomuraea guangzhouensis]
MTVIESNQGVITQINVFDVDPDKVDLLITTLQEAARTVTHIPGWISANLHVSLDRTKVTNYAQCASKEAWDAVMEVVYANGYIEKLTAVARPNPCLYNVVWTLDHTQVTPGP